MGRYINLRLHTDNGDRATNLSHGIFVATSLMPTVTHHPYRSDVRSHAEIEFSSGKA